MSIESSNATNFELYLNGFLADTSLANNYFVEHIDNEILRVQLKDSSGTQLFNENVVIQLDQHNAFMFDPTQRTLELIAQSADFSIEFLLFSGNKFTFPNIVSPASKKEKVSSPPAKPEPIEDFTPLDDSISFASKEKNEVKNEVERTPLDTQLTEAKLPPQCKSLIPPVKFDLLLNGLSTTRFGGIQLRMIQNQTKEFCVNTEQLSQILPLLDDDDLKLDALRSVVQQWVDPENKSTILSLFRFDYAKKEVISLTQ